MGIPDVVRMDPQGRFRGEVIDIVVPVANLSNRDWVNASLFTCFAYYAAPLSMIQNPA